jgi:hypothetical protein
VAGILKAIATLSCHGKPFQKDPAVISVQSTVFNSNFTISESVDFQGVINIR